jgi:hypothetical protein
MFQRLLAKLVSGQVISFGVGSSAALSCLLCGMGGLLYCAVSHRECSSDEPLGKPPTALAGQAYHRNRFFSSQSLGLYQS